MPEMGKEHKAAILGLGSYAPEKVLTNHDFTKFLDTSDEWITERTGIKRRHVVAKGESTSDLAERAGRAAIKDAGLEPKDLDFVLVATFSPDYITPATACAVQEKLGLGEVGTPACDINAACSGFLYGLATAKCYVESGLARNVLLVGAEAISRFTNYQDRTTCILFGDGAGSVVVGRAREKKQSHVIKEVRIWADGRGKGQIITPAGGSVHPPSHQSVDEHLQCIRMNGREVFKFAVGRFMDMLQEVLTTYNLKAKDIGAIVPHQANVRIIDSAVERLGLPRELFLLNIQEYGNTSSASIPLALDEAHRQGRVPAGKPVIMLAFGGGLTWGWALVEW
jgi:3-oxoacyl-[acyl-carrier-protein] synthase-3